MKSAPGHTPEQLRALARRAADNAAHLSQRALDLIAESNAQAATARAYAALAEVTAKGRVPANVSSSPAHGGGATPRRQSPPGPFKPTSDCP